MNIFLAPHNDDEALFGAFIIQRTHPLVVVVTDGKQHQDKFNIPIEKRRDESKAGCMELGVDVHMVKFLGIPDDDVTEDAIEKEFRTLEKTYHSMTGIVFAPSIQGGQVHHDMVSRMAKKVWKDKVMYYGTYTRENFSPTGEMPISPTDNERNAKTRALACYASQIGLNGAHFNAVQNVPEYISFKP